MLSRPRDRWTKHTAAMAEYQAMPITAIVPNIENMQRAHNKDHIEVLAVETPGWYDIYVNPAWAGPVIYEWLWYALAEFKPTIRNSQEYQAGFTDGLKSFFNIRFRRVPLGLRDELRAALKKLRAFRVDAKMASPEHLQQAAPEPTLPNIRANLVKYEPWQEKAIAALMSHRRGLLAAPMNFGKTEVMISVIHQRRLPSIIVAPLKSIIDDAFGNTAVKLDGWRVMYMHSDYTPTIEEILNADLIATTPKKFLNWLGKNKHVLRDVRRRFQQMFIDECHEAMGKMHEQIIQLVQPFYLYGASGTVRDPLWDYNTACILEKYGPILYEDTTMDMVGRGMSAKPIVEFHSPLVLEPPEYRAANGRTVKQRLPSTVAAEYDFKHSIWGNKNLMKYIVDDISSEAAQGRQCLCVCTRKLMWNAVGDAMRHHHPHLRMDMLWGGSHTRERKEALGRFAEGDLDLLLVMNIFDMGINLPAIDVLWLPQATEPDFWRRTLQRIGRSLRKQVRSSESEETAIIKIPSFEHSERYCQKHVRLRKLFREGFDFEIREVLR